MDGVRSVLAAHGGVPPLLRMGGVDASIPMLLHGVGSSDAGLVQAATDIMLVSAGLDSAVCATLSVVHAYT